MWMRRFVMLKVCFGILLSGGCSGQDDGFGDVDEYLLNDLGTVDLDTQFREADGYIQRGMEHAKESERRLDSIVSDLKSCPNP